jgi:uncharacterized protein (TIGR00251 family)
MPAWYHWDGDDLLLNVHVQPRSREDRIMGLHGDALKIKISSPPVDGKANQYLCTYLAKLCGISKGAVSIESGDTARRKRVRLKLPGKSIPAGLLNY